MPDAALSSAADATGYSLSAAESSPPPSGAPLARAWRVPVARIFDDADMRLDASFFDPGIGGASEAAGSYPVDRLGDLADVTLPGIFERVWAADRNHGLPYLNATDLLPLFALGVPARERFLSLVSDTDIETLVVRKDWLLMTGSGTIGRVYHVPERLDGWAATHDLIRIVPKSPDLVGYLYAWLSTPNAQAQILRYTYGGQITHVTDRQISELPVPRLPRREAADIAKRVIDALETRERALRALSNAWIGE